MKLFPGLFYIACVILLGVRLRPLHHSWASATNFFWWQKELNPWVGWTYRLLSAFVNWLCKLSATLQSSTAAPDPGYSHLPLWRPDSERLKTVVSQCVDLLKYLYAPVAKGVDSIHSNIAAPAGDQTKELMRNILALLQTASHPLFELPGFGHVPLITELEELGVVEELGDRIVDQVTGQV